MQVVDIVALRPEVELCYMGVGTKCFEILESRRDWDSRTDASHLGLPSVGATGTGSEDGEEEEDDEEEEEELDADSDADEETESDAENNDDDDDDDDDDDFDDDITDSDSDSSDAPRKGGRNGRAAKLRLREILFYDDKVAVFKARHGKL